MPHRVLAQASGLQHGYQGIRYDSRHHVTCHIVQHAWVSVPDGDVLRREGLGVRSFGALRGLATGSWHWGHGVGTQAKVWKRGKEEEKERGKAGV